MPRPRSAVPALLLLPALALAACGSGTKAATVRPVGVPSGTAVAATGAAPGTSATSSGAPGAGTATPAGGAPAGSAPAGSAAPSGAVATSAPPEATLPDGSLSVLPQHRVVALYGPPDGSITRNILGRLTPAQATMEVKKRAAAFASGGRPVLPAFEVLAQIAQGSPGQDGDYAAFYQDSDIDKWVNEATKQGFLVVLDLQPGQGDFLAGAKHLQKWLVKPNVGLALDAEWNMKKGEVPGSVIGSVDAAKVNEVSQWLAQLTASRHLPQKLFVVHQFVESAVTNKSSIVLRPGLATVIHVDGFGGQPAKLSKYSDLHVMRRGEYNGFKLFLTDDVGLLTPQQTLALKPAPDLVTYQ